MFFFKQKTAYELRISDWSSDVCSSDLFPVEWGLDLQTEHERWLTEVHIGRPVVVMNYPEHIKAFYMRLNDDGKTVAAMDVLAPGIGEIIGGAQREERLGQLDTRMAAMGIEANQYQRYRDLRRYGRAQIGRAHV